MDKGELLAYVVLGNPVQDWLYAALTLVFTAFALRLLLRSLAARLSTLAERTDTRVDDIAVRMLRQVRWWVLATIGVFAAARFVEIPDQPAAWIDGAAMIAVLAQAGIWVSGFVSDWVEHSRKRRLADAPAAATGLVAVGIVARVVVWSMVLLIALDNLGVDVTALVASLGVGGVAVALAVQNILGDLFASFSIIFDKPFVVGDFLIIDSHMGSVENVGLKTTRLRSLTGEQLVFSNSDLLGSRIRNYGRMQERRVAFDIGVTYETPRSKLEKIPALIRQAVERQPEARFDRAHFKSYGDFSLMFETVYYVGVPDYNVYMDVQQDINLAIHASFEREDIDFAYPTQTLILRQSA